MYLPGGGSAYRQQSYSAQQVYGQTPGPGYSGSSVGAPDAGSQLSLASRRSMLGGSQEVDMDIVGYRSHPSGALGSAAHYGGQYGAAYGTPSLGVAQQLHAMGGNGVGSSVLQGRSGPSMGLKADDYGSSSSHGFGQKNDQFSGGTMSDYASMDIGHYGENQSAYMGRSMQSESNRRYSDSVGLAHQHQSDLHDQVSMLHHQQLLKAQSGSDMRPPLTASAVDGSPRPTDYLAARGATIRHVSQDLSSYGGRMDGGDRNLSMLSGPSYGGQHPSSILEGASRRNLDDLMYTQGSSATAYGVSLPPGRDYSAGKGLGGASLESAYPGSVLSRAGHPNLVDARVDDRKDDRSVFSREFEMREEECRREHLRAREKEREREREKERGRERERERERERLLERRDKERERERKLGRELRRERTPPRITRDRQGSSLIREERPRRRDSSPRYEALHRRHSPIKDKRREYVCKVYPFCLVDVVRDYLSINKRYPRLSISPEFSKLILNWPRESLNISFCTPVSFEHDFVEVDSKAELKGTSAEPSTEEVGRVKRGSTVWNAKVVLMSGISDDALEELCSDKSFDERLAHFNNILRFAFVRKSHSFTAIGGPWDAVDGEDPSLDDSSLIQTALRYAKDVTQLDLQNCQNWNPFLEVHYNRLGKDGQFSHKEITVLFVPDLSDCLPSLDLWRSQWLTHKKAIAEREHQLSLKREKKSKSNERKDSVKGDSSLTKSEKDIDCAKPVKMESDHAKDEKEEKQDGALSDKAIVVMTTEKLKKDGNKSKENASEQNGMEDKQNSKMDVAGTSVAQENEVRRPAKKRIVRKISKDKVTEKKDNVATPVSKQTEKLVEKNVDDNEGEPSTMKELFGDAAELASDVKTSVKKEVVKKEPTRKSSQKEDKVGNVNDKDVEPHEGTPEIKEQDGTSAGQGLGVKSTEKKKIIRRVPKKKAAEAVDKTASGEGKKDENNDAGKLVVKENEQENKKEQAGVSDEVKKSDKKVEKSKEPKKKAVEKRDMGDNENEKKTEKGVEDKKEGKKLEDKDPKGGDADTKRNMETEITKNEDLKKSSQDGKRERIKDEKEKKSKQAKDGIETKEKPTKEEKEKGKPQEPPRHPGLFLQTKWSKDSKLSLFAESMYEMLQYQMGCRLLAFLEKLHHYYLSKRSQRKRQWDKGPAKESGKEISSQKRSKFCDKPEVQSESTKSKMQDATNSGREEAMAEEVAEEDALEVVQDESKMNSTADEDDPEEEFEEDPEEEVYEDQEMNDAETSHDASKEAETGEKDKAENKGKTDSVNLIEEKTEEKSETQLENKSEEKTAKANGEPDTETTIEKKSETEKKADATAKDGIVDKELLQAFRFFDRNRVGYIKVEDLRLIIHTLGKFVSHRDVKELVHSALLESNTARDNRVLYNKLVRLAI